MATIGSTLESTQSGSGASNVNRFSELTSEDFVKIMFTELQNQDPLKPNDSNALLQQFSSLRSIESDLALQKNLQDVVKQGQLSTAGGLIGKKIQGYTEQFDAVEGVVKSVSQSDDGPVMNLANGWRVPFKNIASILDPTQTTTTGTGSNNGSGSSGNGSGTNGTGSTGSTQPGVTPSTTPPNSGLPGGGTGSTSNGGGAT